MRVAVHEKRVRWNRSFVKYIIIRPGNRRGRLSDIWTRCRQRPVPCGERSASEKTADDLHNQQATDGMGEGITRRRYGRSYPRSSPRTRTLHPSRWTLRQDASSQPRRGLAVACRPCQNFRNWRVRISGTHTNWRDTTSEVKSPVEKTRLDCWSKSASTRAISIPALGIRGGLGQRFLVKATLVYIPRSPWPPK